MTPPRPTCPTCGKTTKNRGAIVHSNCRNEWHQAKEPEEKSS